MKVMQVRAEQENKLRRVFLDNEVEGRWVALLRMPRNTLLYAGELFVLAATVGIAVPYLAGTKPMFDSLTCGLAIVAIGTLERVMGKPRAEQGTR